MSPTDPISAGMPLASAMQAHAPAPRAASEKRAGRLALRTALWTLLGAAALALPARAQAACQQGGNLSGYSATVQFVDQINAIEVQALDDLYVGGFALYSSMPGTTGGSYTGIPTYLYLKVGQQPAQAPVRSGTLTVNTTEKYYATYFDDGPIEIPQGTVFYLAYAVLPDYQFPQQWFTAPWGPPTGQTTPHFVRYGTDPGQGSWNGPYDDTNWLWRVMCSPPAIDFTWSPVPPCAGDAAQFQDVSDGYPTAWEWTFNNGDTSDNQSTSHTFNNPGQKTVWLKAWNKGGSASGSETVQVVGAGADFAVDDASVCWPETVQFTSTSQGPATSWDWDLDGDGDIDLSGIQSFAYQYPSGGVYTVSLTVGAMGCSDTETKADYVTVTKAEFTTSPPVDEPHCINTSVQFTDQTNAPAIAWDWNFGDGSPNSSLQNPTHSYSSQGTYTVTLTATSESGCEAQVEKDLVLVAPPVASFTTEDPPIGCPGLEVEFENTSSGATDYSWTFGDGATSSNANPVHVYQSAGSYKVTLTASVGTSCSDTEIKFNYVQVLSAPAASFTHVPHSGFAPLAVSFQDGSTQFPSDYEWDFDGNGTVDSTEQDPVHVYPAGGLYEVHLEAQNCAGSGEAVQPLAVANRLDPVWTRDGQNAGARLGASVAGAGDVDGDGRADLLVGAPGDNGPTTAGPVLLLSGADGSVLRSFLPAGEELGSFGAALAGAGDVDLDGVPDLVVGDPTVHNQGGGGPGGCGNGDGRAYVFSGSSGALLHSWKACTTGDALGTAVAGAGDVDGDGRPDLIVSAPGESGGGGGGGGGGQGGNGRVHVYSGSDGSEILGLSSAEAGSTSELGAAVAGGADADGDGTPDVLVGDPGASAPTVDDGRVLLYSGQSGALLHALDSGVPGAALGTAVSFAGDLDGDGRTELLAGAPGTQYPYPMGEVRLWSGASGALLASLAGISADDAFGAAVSGGLDADGDGVPDVLIGAPGEGFTGVETGRAILYSGRSQTVLQLFHPQSTASFDRAGSAVALFGDATLDGYADAAFGVPEDDLGGAPDAGSAWVFSLVPEGVSHYGTGTPGCAGPQVLHANQAPEIGASGFQITCNAAPPFPAFGFLAIAAAPDVAGSDPLGLGILLHVDLSTFLLSTSLFGGGNGMAVAPVPIPSATGLIGFHAYLQGVWAWNGTCLLTPYDLSSTSGLSVVLLAP